MSVANTRAPSRAKAAAAQRPMPAAPAVTNARLPFRRSPMSFSLSFSFVIPGRDEVANPESITTIGSMDSGPAPSGASRNDDLANDYPAPRRPGQRCRDSGLRTPCRRRWLHVHDLGAAGITDRTGAAHEQDAVLVDVERRIVDPFVIILRSFEHDGASIERVGVFGIDQIAVAEFL